MDCSWFFNAWFINSPSWCTGSFRAMDTEWTSLNLNPQPPRLHFPPRNTLPPCAASAARFWTGRLPMARPCQRWHAAVPAQTGGTKQPVVSTQPSTSPSLGMQKNKYLRPTLLLKTPPLLTFQMNIQHPQLNSVNIAKLDKYHINYCDQILPTIPAIHILVEVHIPFLFPSHPRPIFQTRIHQLVRYYHHCDSCYYHHCVFFISCRRLNYS